jgi:hypothetical protein
MRPTQFVTQRVTIWEGLVEQPHVAKIRHVEPLAKISRQALCQPVQQPGAVFGVIGADLFELDNVTPHLPAGSHLNRIHRPQRLPPRVLDECPQSTQQIIQRGCRRRGRILFCHSLVHRLLTFPNPC